MFVLLAVYCLLIVAASVAGGWLPLLIRMTHLRTQLLMSFVAGLMLGIAMLHMLPHAAELVRPAGAGAAALAGLIAMFLLMRAFHVHAHGEFVEIEGDSIVGVLVDGEPRQSQAELNGLEHEHGDEYEHEHERGDGDEHGDRLAGARGHVQSCGHSHAGGQHHSHRPHSKIEFGWMGMFFGLGLHTLMDGVALGASIAAELHHDPFLGLAGLGTFLAVVLHKPLDAFAITSVMRKDGWNASQQTMVNLLFSLTCPLGAILFFAGAFYLSDSAAVLGWGLAISAGFFICISLADLLPEVAFHDHDRFKLTIALLLGVALAVMIESLPGHDHESHEHESQSAAVSDAPDFQPSQPNIPH